MKTITTLTVKDYASPLLALARDLLQEVDADAVGRFPSEPITTHTLHREGGAFIVATILPSPQLLGWLMALTILAEEELARTIERVERVAGRPETEI